MSTDTGTPAAATDRRSSNWLAWAAFGALLATLAIEARDVARRSAMPAPVIEVEASNRVIVGVPPEEIVSVPPVATVIPASLLETQSAAVTAEPVPPAPAAEEPSLIGMKAATLRATLGAPDFVRRDGRSQMWRYGSGGCTLTVFLHGQGAGLTVEHVEGRGLRSLRDAGADCGERLVGERRPADLPG